MAYVLETQEIGMHFGGVRAVDGISAQVEPTEIFGIIGPNGSGKSTLINVLTGVYRPTHGQVRFLGEEITGMKPHKIAGKGIARTFQNLRLFHDMTVLENAIIGQHVCLQTAGWQAMLGTKKYKESERHARERAMEILELVGLDKMTGEIAADMAYGQQKRLELARALVSEPQLCLLDEPAAGLNSKEAMAMMALIKRIREKKGITFILIEHNMEAMMSTADRIMVMDAGKRIAEDVPEVIKNDPKVIRVYLGEEGNHAAQNG